MANWLFMFRPETYENVKAHGTVGVRKGARKSFAALKKGDRFVAYVSREKLFDGYGEITSDVFEDDTNIFLDDPPPPLADPYRDRCNVRFEKTGAALPADNTLWGLTPLDIEMKTSAANYIHCKGGFLRVPDSDFSAIQEWLDGHRETPWPKV